jgi:uncharacterized membrane protein
MDPGPGLEGGPGMKDMESPWAKLVSGPLGIAALIFFLAVITAAIIKLVFG